MDSALFLRIKAPPGLWYWWNPLHTLLTWESRIWGNITFACFLFPGHPRVPGHFPLRDITTALPRTAGSPFSFCDLKKQRFWIRIEVSHSILTANQRKNSSFLFSPFHPPSCHPPSTHQFFLIVLHKVDSDGAPSQQVRREQICYHSIPSSFT